MIHFLLISTISMAVLLAVYHLLLQREKMYRFNRFYLLGAVVFSLAVPFITIPVYIEAEQVVTATPIVNNIIKQVPAVATPVQEVTSVHLPELSTQVQDINYWTYIILGLYILIIGILIIRFIVNIRHFYIVKNQSKTIPFKGATLVLTEGNILPHTFLNNIYLNKEDFEKLEIEPELLTHELTHVRQHHTLDVLLIEVIKAFLWFNPLLYLYKKAIQLNHEFLADEAVIIKYNNVTGYQELLLTKATPAFNFALSSSINFSLTKKRFAMMTKTTSVFKAFILKIALAPVLTGLLFILCTKAVAQEIVSAAGTKYYTAAELFAETTFRFTDKEGNVIEKKFATLNEKEKEQVKNHMPNFFVEKKQPTQTQLNEWKDSKTFIVWLDDQIISNDKLAKYKPKDIASYEAVIIDDLKAGETQKYNVKLRTQKYFDDIVGQRNDSPNRKLKLLEFNDLPDGVTAEENVESYFIHMVYYASATDKQAEFPGGTEAFSKFINDNYNKNYENRRSGTLEVSFVIEKDGSLSDIKVEKDTGGNSQYEIVRVLQNSPKWIPAIRKNKIVRSRPDEPIKITLQ